MKQTDYIFDVHLQSDVDIVLPDDTFGNIFILGNRSALADKISDIRSTIIDLSIINI